MKKLIALFSEKRKEASITSFRNDVLTSYQLVNIRGGGEPAIMEMPIIIPPDET